MNQKQNPALSANSEPGLGNTSKLNPSTKRAAVLRTFLRRGEHGLNCFQAVSECHDYVLRSSVSDLQRQYGLTFRRKWEQVTGYQHSKVDCMRYWLAPESVALACDLLGRGSGPAPLADVAEGLI